MLFFEPEPEEAKIKELERRRLEAKQAAIMKARDEAYIKAIQEFMTRNPYAAKNAPQWTDQETDVNPDPPKTQSPGWTAQGKPAWAPPQFIRTERGDFYRLAIKDPRTGGLLGYIYAGDKGLMIDATDRFVP